MGHVAHPASRRISGDGRSLAPLHGVLRTYDWGSRTLLAELQGRPSPTAGREAELWFGSHPSASAVLDREGGSIDLGAAIASDPLGELGPTVLRGFGARLPFLVKLLAVERALSVQLHPTSADAEAGHADEERLGIGLDDPSRCFPDPWGKSELVLALSAFEGRVGLRTHDEVRALLDRLSPGVIGSLEGPISGPPLGEADDVAALAAAVLAAAADDRRALLARLVDGARALDLAPADIDPTLLADARTLLRLVEERPDDAGAVMALMLAPVLLEEGEAFEIPTGVIHSYQRGVAVEVMVASDCVIRFGLTEKATRPSAGFRLASTTAHGRRLGPVPTEDGWAVLPSSPAEFRVETTAVESVSVGSPRGTRHGPAILLCTRGEIVAAAGEDSASLGRGGAAFLSARASGLTMEGDGAVVLVSSGAPAGGSA